jgi:hypothetical protein
MPFDAVMNIGSATQWLFPNYQVSLGYDSLDMAKCDFWQSAPYYPGHQRNTKGLVDQTRFERVDLKI